MNRIDGPGATVDNLFTEGDPSLGIPATTVTAQWLNGVQEELIHVLTTAGVTPDAATNTQIMTALSTLFFSKLVPEKVSARNVFSLKATTVENNNVAVADFATLAVGESTAVSPLANNTVIFAINAKITFTTWTRQAFGASFAIAFDHVRRSLVFLDGGTGESASTITWVEWGNLVIAGATALTVSGIASTHEIASSEWTEGVGVNALDLRVKRYPDATLHITSTDIEIPGGSATGLDLATTPGNPLNLVSNVPQFLHSYNANNNPTNFGMLLELKYVSASNLTVLRSVAGTPGGTAFSGIVQAVVPLFFVA